jgi:hypothetical protein
MEMMKRLMLLAPLMLASCVIYRTPDGWTPAREPLTPDHIVTMKQGGQTDAQIRSALDFHGLDHKLTSDELVMLKDAGVGDGLLTAATEAQVKTPEEARPIYSRSSHRHYDCAYCRSAAPVYVATALSLNYLFGHWGHHHHRHYRRW